MLNKLYKKKPLQKLLLTEFYYYPVI